MNKRKIIINIIMSISSQAIILFLGLIVPRIILLNYGSDTNGLTSTIGQIFAYMALLEAGISQAARNRLYEPIKNNDLEGISYWVSASRHSYRKISIIYFFCVIVLSFIAPLVLKTSIPYLTVFLYVLFEGLTCIVSFYFLNSWNCLLSADGKEYVTNSIMLVSKILMYGVKIVLAINGWNIFLIQVGYFLVSLIQLLIYWLYMRKKYKWLDYNAAPKNAKLPDRNAFIVTEVAWTIFSSTDMIVLSVFVSTSLASVYSIYSMVYIALNSIMNALYHSLTYNLGQTFTHDFEKYKRVHSLFNSIFMGAMTILMCVTYCLMIPFVKIYTEGVSDVHYVYHFLPLLFCLVQMLSWSRYVSGYLTGIAGYAKQTSFVSLVEAGINLVGSIILVFFFDITGVLLATVIALPIKAIWCNWMAEAKIMKRNPLKTILTFLTDWLVFAITAVVFFFVELKITTYLHLMLYGSGLLLVYFCVVFALNCLINKDILKLKLFFTKKQN